MKKKCFLIVIIICLLLYGCSKETIVKSPFVQVNGDVISEDVFERAREEAAYKKFSDNEIIEGLILETIVLQQQNHYGIAVNREEVNKRYDELLKVDPIFLEEVMEKYSTEEELKQALFNKIVYEKVEDAINKEFENKYILNEDVLMLRTTDYISQYDLEDTTAKEFEKKVYDAYRDIELNELKNLYFQAKQFRLVNMVEIYSERIDISQLFCPFEYIINKNDLQCGTQEYEMIEVSVAKMQQLFGNVLYISNEVVSKNAKIHCVYEPQINIKCVMVNYDDLQISAIISPRISLVNTAGYSEFVLKTDGRNKNKIEIVQKELGIIYCVEGGKEFSELADILNKMIPYRVRNTNSLLP